MDFTGDGSRPIKVSISLTLDEPILTKIQELAELEDRSVSSYITLILRTHLERLEQ
ncbi:ribbon-helix-helix domain-containing protein [Pseudoflavonifractor sp. MSJ-37]|nr:ribbon-helix-helix domain-containing protein [Pseudoflavonifractor sp. MSJ-37]